MDDNDIDKLINDKEDDDEELINSTQQGDQFARIRDQSLRYADISSIHSHIYDDNNNQSLLSHFFVNQLPEEATPQEIMSIEQLESRNMLQTPGVSELLSRISRAVVASSAVNGRIFLEAGETFKQKYNLRTPASRSVNVSGRTQTPGTISYIAESPGLNNVTKGIIVIAIVAGRGQAQSEIGVASMDIRTTELSMSQFCDTSAYARLRNYLNVLQPVELIVPDTATSPLMKDNLTSMKKIIELLTSDLPDTQITMIKRKYFNDSDGLGIIKKVCVKESVYYDEVSSKYYCLAAVSALIKYVEFIQNISFTNDSIKATFTSIDKTCIIDPVTVKNLELLFPLKASVGIVSGQSTASLERESLYGQMNYTQTASGGRLLRSALLQPLTSQAEIEHRLDALSEILLSEVSFNNIRALVSRLIDVDQLITICAQINRESSLRLAEHKITQIINLKHTLELMPALSDQLGPLKSRMFKRILEMLKDSRLQEIIDRCNAVLDDQCHVVKGMLNMRLQKCYAVRAGLNGQLDLTRRAYADLTDQVHVIAASESDDLNLPFNVAYSNSRGYHLQIMLKRQRLDKRLEQPELPIKCVNVQYAKSCITCTTRSLMKVNERINQSVAEIILMSDTIVHELIKSIREFVGCLYNISEAIGQLDFITSLAHYIALSPKQMVRPEFTDITAIKQGRHPVLERVSHTHIDVQPNDMYYAKDSTFALITGPNMAGKSTYLKQVALIQVLAQAGCYVPAEYASVRIVMEILSRFGHNDDLNNNISTFEMEMKDCAHILQLASDKSLVLIDELGRSTANEEGVGICHAICEHLINSNAYVVFATHFLDLTAIQNLYANVQNYHFGNIKQNKDGKNIKFSHKLFKGPYRGPIYGFEYSDVWGFPDQVINDARITADQLRASVALTCKQTKVTRKANADKFLLDKFEQVIEFGDKMDIDDLLDHLMILERIHSEELTDIKLNDDTSNERSPSLSDHTAVSTRAKQNTVCAENTEQRANEEVLELKRNNIISHLPSFTANPTTNCNRTF